MLLRFIPWLLAASAMPAASVPAFPGAEGFGAGAAGGRGGDVYHVTNLNDSGAGSLRYGIQTASGPRTIVFDVSGTIVLKSALSINRPFLTLAGQTAPGGGVTVAGWTVAVSNTHDVIVRYLRFRAGDLECPRMQGDSLTVDRSSDVILDHVSASWSIDETLSVTDSDRVTVQWSIVAESLNTACHEKGEHGYGSLLRYGEGGISFHHNLFAHHRSRNPRLGDNLRLDFVNNVLYNAGGEVGYSGEAEEGTPRMNYAGNYIVAGPSTSSSRRFRAFLGGSANTRIYQSGNLVDGNLNGVRDGVDTGWAMFAGAYTRHPERFDFPLVQADEAAAAYRRVLESAGQALARDAVDERVLADVARESGKIIGSQSEVGGWPELRAGSAPVDSDRDGMPDEWEIGRKLDPEDPADGAALTATGYTHLEHYLNELAAPPAPPAITSQPRYSSLTVMAGSSATLAARASGGALSYQWRKDGEPISGNPSAATPTLILAGVQPADAGSYALAVSNAAGAVTSNAVVLKVSLTPVPGPPTISIQPAGATAPIGQSATLSVTAAGSSLSYQWFRNGSAIPGAVSAVLTLINLETRNSGTYWVIVSNPGGVLSSAPAGLLVVSPMYATSVWPWPGYTGLCPDARLSIEFSQPPMPGVTGRVRVYTEAGTLFDSIDMAARPETRSIGGNIYSYDPVTVTDNTASIHLHRQFPYGGSFYVTVDPGALTDASGAPFAGLSGSPVWRFHTRPAGPAPGASGLAVAADDSGDFCTVQGAIDYVPAGNTRPVHITVRPGRYTGIHYVPASKPFLTVRGEDRHRTVIEYPNNNALNPSTAGRALFGADAPDFGLEDLTLHNTTPKGGSQAEAFRGGGSRTVLRRVTLKSHQDTLLIQGTAYIVDSLIEGDVDFLWGGGPAYFVNCELKALASGGYLTQVRNGQGQAGFVFVNSRLTAAPGVTGVYLSRIDPNLFPYSQVVFLNSVLGRHLHPEGWLLNHATTAPNLRFWEYGSQDEEGRPADVSRRHAASRQITAQEAAQWSDPAFVLGGWNPGP